MTQPRFRGNLDYKTEFSTAVTGMFDNLIAGRQARIYAAQTLVDDYFACIGEMPEGTELERLADLILNEELTDKHPDKVTRTEYPFLSESQFARRRNNETSLDRAAESLDANGVDHRKPTRRLRNKWEDAFVDENAQIRNADRQRHYSAFKYGKNRYSGGGIRFLQWGGKSYSNVKI
ncbi:hypothetical protein KM924_23175 [Brevibacillus parabrevis]|uniref:hypothetical protein n=1 Tax=Brevibacillus parabrevis TaxID=54914 RepID=UPI001C2239AD|nr:hypothetical protein [Brevibacillus parabrevis]MBU8715408.1 hypothetical protein [Brevibacillus parabrevis]